MIALVLALAVAGVARVCGDNIDLRAIHARGEPEQLKLIRPELHNTSAGIKLGTILIRSTSQDPGIWSPLREALDRYRQFRSDPTQPRITKIGDMKTHKTASTTISSILYRFGARHELRIFRPPGHTRSGIPKSNFAPYMTASYANKFDLEFHHTSAFGDFKQPYDVVVQFYRHILGPNMRMISALRDPRQQLISYVYFFLAPKSDKPALKVLDKVLDKGMHDLLCREFGVHTQAELDRFLQAFMNQFSLFILVERFNESLVLLRRIFNWDLLDITYLKLLDSHSKAGSHRWDGREIEPTPKLDDLPDSIRSKIEEACELDMQLYKLAVKQFESLKQIHGSGFDEEVAAFEDVQGILAATCRDNPNHAGCLWYAEDDIFSLYTDHGLSQDLMFLGT